MSNFFKKLCNYGTQAIITPIAAITGTIDYLSDSSSSIEDTFKEYQKSVAGQGKIAEKWGEENEHNVTEVLHTVHKIHHILHGKKH